MPIDADPKRVAPSAARASRSITATAPASSSCEPAASSGRAALVVTLDTPSAIEAVVTAVREERPDLTIVARARDARHATQLYDLGVDDAVPETIEASLQLSEAVLVDIGVPMGLVIASIHERRDEFRAMLKKTDKPGEQAGFRARRTVGKRAQ